MARRRNKQDEKRIVRARVHALLSQAEAEAGGPDDDLADRYGRLTLRLARRYQMPLPPDAKPKVCRKCGAFVRASTRRVRLAKGRIVTTCTVCGHTHRRPL